MAKKSKVARNNHRIKIVKRYAERRAELLNIIRDVNVDDEEKELASVALRKLPRDSSPTRVRNRCHLTGRPRGTYSKFGLSRMALRERALRGELPGVTKASW